VVFNLITAVLVFSIVLSYFGVLTTKVSEVSAGSAAQAAGVRAGDRIVRIEGHRVGSWEALSSRVARYDAGDTVTVVVDRAGTEVTLRATLTKNPETGTGLLGVSPTIEKPTPLQAVGASVGYIGLTFMAILQFFNPETARQALSQSASVIGASYIAADAARTSALNYAAIVALLSLSLGVINIFPIPPLDGGKVAIELFERLRGRPLSRRVSLALSATGAILLFGLIFYLMYADVVRYILS
jgi:regulator of sigma E protease